MIYFYHDILLNYMKGYLPAEHIETPTERLARLNKHRNIDVRMICASLNALIDSGRPVK
jgi:hypothetical protein